MSAPILRAPHGFRLPPVRCESKQSENGLHRSVTESYNLYNSTVASGCYNELCTFLLDKNPLYRYNYYSTTPIRNAIHLRESNAGIAEIASQTGFSSTAYFSKIFRQYKFCTPGEYRKINTKV